MAKLIVEWIANQIPGVKLRPDNDWHELHILERIDFYKDLIEQSEINLEALELERIKKRRLKWIDFNDRTR